MSGSERLSLLRSGLALQQPHCAIRGNDNTTLPEHWRDEVRRKLVEAMQSAGQDVQSLERERERLRLNRSRILKQHREGYIDDIEFQAR